MTHLLPKRLVPLVLALAGVGFSSAAVGCKPYDKPAYSEIDTSETGFLIPLEGDAGRQTTFESETYLDQRKVAAKRVMIPHQWSQTGRMPWDGDWIDTVRLVKVDRSPVTREWTADSDSGTSKKDEAIWVESRDSVGFSVGFNCTAFIKEADTAKFLYMYRSKSLSDMMDTEVRARIQSKASEVAAEYDLDELRGRKQEIIDAVRSDVTGFFAERGISITTIGMFGGFTYENAAIQKSIDETFVAQQLKVLAKAKFDAQLKDNERIELEAKGEAAKEMTVAQARADGLMKLAEATKAAQSDPLFLKLKQLEVEEARVARWDGKFPVYLMNFGGGEGQNGVPQMLLQIPDVATAK